MRKEPFKRCSLDMPPKMHKTVKQLALDKETNMTQYILDLIKQDLAQRNIQF